MKRRNDERKSRISWSATEDDALLKAVVEEKQDRDAGADADDEEDWDEIANNVVGKTPVQCLKRYMVLNKRKKIKDEDTEVSSDTAMSTNRSREDRKLAPEERREVERGSFSKEEEGDYTDGMEGQEYKRPRTEGDGSTNWPQDDVDLLKKLVENYKDCKSTNMLYSRMKCKHHFSLYSVFFLNQLTSSLPPPSSSTFKSCASLERDSCKLFQ